MNLWTFWTYFERFRTCLFLGHEWKMMSPNSYQFTPSVFRRISNQPDLYYAISIACLTLNINIAYIYPYYAELKCRCKTVDWLLVTQSAVYPICKEMLISSQRATDLMSFLLNTSNANARYPLMHKMYNIQIYHTYIWQV